MSQDTNHHDLDALWHRCLEQGMEAWKTSLPHTVAALQVWGDAVGRGMESWAQTLQQDVSAPEALAQWKKLMDETVETWSKSLAEAMASEDFAAAMGRSLDQYLNAVGPVRKNLQSASEEVLRTLNVPSRKQVTRLAAGIVAVDERLEAMDDRLEALDDRVKAMHEQLVRLLDRRPAEPATEAATSAAPHGRKPRPQNEVR